jgi:GDSL/SGNH-like Acyl-Esterase family found in Pmr5 and Cas1p
MDSINSWSWFPDRCAGDPVPRIDPVRFLNAIRGRKIGFVGDSLNENFLTALLCVLWPGDETARKWKRKGAWRGGYFSKFNLIVGYHRAVLLANYT